jgi:hypothetical protein
MILEFVPTPEQEGVQQFKEVYQRRFDKEISSEEAFNVLSRLMHFIYLIQVLPHDTELPPEPTGIGAYPESDSGSSSPPA